MAPTSKHSIPFDEAKEMVRKYQTSVPPSARKSCYFTRDAFDIILAQKDCVGIRIYLASELDTEGLTTVVLAGQNADNVVQDDTAAGDSLMEISPWCPPICDFTDRLSE